MRAPHHSAATWASRLAITTHSSIGTPGVEAARPRLVHPWIVGAGAEGSPELGRWPTLEAHPGFLLGLLGCGESSLPSARRAAGFL